MNEPDNQTPETVAEWLAIATFRLVPAARERIKLEIQAYYTDLVAARLADGTPQKDAESAALLELGEPSKAAKQFRKQHLTEDEKQYLDKWVESTRRSMIFSWWFAFCLSPLIAIQIWCFARSDKLPSTLQWAGLGWSIFFLFTCITINFKFRHLFKEQLPAREFVRRFLRLQFWMVISQLTVVVTSVTVEQPKAGYRFSLVLVSIGLAIWLSRNRALFRKLSKYGAPDLFEMVER
jgi:hypothetical protein